MPRAPPLTRLLQAREARSDFPTLVLVRLGAVFSDAGHFEAAEEQLRAALSRATSHEEIADAHLHLAQARFVFCFVTARVGYAASRYHWHVLEDFRGFEFYVRNVFRLCWRVTGMLPGIHMLPMTRSLEVATSTMSMLVNQTVMQTGLPPWVRMQQLRRGLRLLTLCSITCARWSTHCSFEYMDPSFFDFLLELCHRNDIAHAVAGI